jgi:ribosome-binding factor A
VVSNQRVQRIAERIREELAQIILQEAQDPRLAGVTVTDVTVDRELAYADVYVSALEGSPRAGEILAGFRSAGGYLRSELARRVELRTFPRLRFHWDPTPERAEHLEQLLDTLRGETSPDEADAPDRPDEEVQADG